MSGKNITNNYDYLEAQKYYKKLKDKFMGTIQLSLKNVTKEEIKNEKDKIYKDVQTVVENIEPQKKLNEIFQYFGDSIINGTDFAQNLNKYGKNIKEDKLDMIVNDNINMFTKSELSTYLSKAMFKSGIFKKYGGIEAIQARVISLFRIFMKSHLMRNLQHELYGKPLITNAGFIKENLENKSLKELFKKTNIKVTPGGTKTNAQGKETPFDNILSSLKFVQNVFNNQITITDGILDKTDLSIDKMTNKLLNNIKYFGQQVKSFSNLDSNAFFSSSGVKIGERSNINKTNTYMTYRKNIAFMGQFRNIIKTFGAGTIMFSFQEQNMWMDDFIREFRNRGYYLMLEDLSSEEVKELGNTVYLTSIYSQTKQQLRKQFR